MKIVIGVARGLEYMHNKAKPPVIYRDLKASNILLDEKFHPKLSDFGLAKLAPVGDDTHISTRVMGTYSYSAPEYEMTGQLTLKSDIYSFGVVLLEIITCRRAIDPLATGRDQNLVAWGQGLENGVSHASTLWIDSLSNISIGALLSEESLLEKGNMLYPRSNDGKCVSQPSADSLDAYIFNHLKGDQEPMKDRMLLHIAVYELLCN